MHQDDSRLKMAQQMEAQARQALAAGFPTKAAMERAKGAASSALDCYVRLVRDVYLSLEHRDRTEAQTNLYYDLPTSAVLYRDAHSQAIREHLPVAAAEYVPHLDRIAELARTIKAAPITPKVKVVREKQPGDRLQYRGHCQCCGALQATANNALAHHGYRVKFGEFRGKCSGHAFAPMEQERKQTDQHVLSLRTRAAEDEMLAAAYRAGTCKPLTCPNGPAVNAEKVPFDQAPEAMRDRHVKTLAVNLDGHARSLRGYANQLLALADKVHGKPLVEVVIEA